MKKVGLLLVGGILFTTTSMAQTTPLNDRWICTTNASGGMTEADKTADDQMKNIVHSASEAFAFASAHCRDCTKINCQIK